MTKQISIGSKVKLTKDIEMFARTYKVGEIFKVDGSSYRGFDLVNDKDERIDETLFVQDSYELYDIKEERKLKLKKLSEQSSEKVNK